MDVQNIVSTFVYHIPLSCIAQPRAALAQAQQKSALRRSVAGGAEFFR